MPESEEFELPLLILRFPYAEPTESSAVWVFPIMGLEFIANITGS